jgi:hypothetical protein
VVLLGFDTDNTPGGILWNNRAREITVCRAVTCKTCGRTTWAGCGQHVDQVMAGVPRRDQCEGHAEEPPKGSFLSRIFGR